MFLTAPSQSDALLLLFIFQHGFHGHAGDHGDIADLVRIARDTDDALLAALVHDRHVDAGKDAREHPVIADHDHIPGSLDNAVRHLMISADPPGIPAGYDHSVFIHDIDVVFRKLSHLLYESAGQFGFDHGCLQKNNELLIYDIEVKRWLWIPLGLYIIYILIKKDRNRRAPAGSGPQFCIDYSR